MAAALLTFCHAYRRKCCALILMIKFSALAHVYNVRIMSYVSQ